MKFKNYIYKKLLLYVAMAFSLFGLWGIANGMHFNKTDLQAMLQGLGDEEAENIREAFKKSRVSFYSNRYPLHAAIMRGNKDDIMVNIEFVEHPSIIDEEDDEGKTPLYVAAYYKNEPAMKLLLKAGAQPDKVLQHSESKFLKKNAYKKIDDLLRDVKLNDTSKPVFNGNLLVDSIKKRSPPKIKIDEHINNILSNIRAKNDDGVYLFNGLINKLVNYNDIQGLKKLFRFKIDGKRLAYLGLCLKDENILFHAINCASKDDYQIVELLISEMDPRDITENGLVACLLAAKQNNDDKLTEIVIGLIETYFPGSNVVNRCNVYKCGRVLIYHKPSNPIDIMNDLMRHKEALARPKKQKLIVKICTFGIAILGFICYKWLKNDKISYHQKLV